jgi:hypothetical protein
MSLSDFLSPVDFNSLSPEDGFYTSHLGSKIEVYQTDFPDLDDNQFDVALIGVLEDRNSINNKGTAKAPDLFRRKFYELNEGNSVDNSCGRITRATGKSWLVIQPTSSGKGAYAPAMAQYPSRCQYRHTTSTTTTFFNSTTTTDIAST